MAGETKRYLLFAGDAHYPNGGWMDLRGAFATAQEAEAEGRRQHDRRDGGGEDDGPWADWWHVVDLQTLRAVAHDGGWDGWDHGGKADER